ncbi:MAG: GNAT family N-acetyltransferase [Rhizobiaceae bacterium]|nr:GNAT family N-acetyltransferase [Rhizobiaceae bacterium]
MARELQARITHLEMRVPPAQRVQAPTGFVLALMRAEAVPLHFYRYLYEVIGRPHHWQMRRGLGDEALSAAIHAETTAIEVLYCDGAPAGFFELDMAGLPEAVEIKYFGLVPDFQGRGLARFLLSAAIFAAWDRRPEKLTIETNTLDSPRALQLYQKLGFSPVSWSEQMIPAWEN